MAHASEMAKGSSVMFKIILSDYQVKISSIERRRRSRPDLVERHKGQQELTL